MALRLGTLNTVFTADTRGLERGFRRARDSFNDVDRRAKSVNESLEETEERATRAKHATGALSGVVSRATKNFNRFAGKMRVTSFAIGTLIGIVSALAEELVALGATAAGVFVNVQLEPVRERLASISETAEQAEQRLDALTDSAAAAGANFLSMGSQMGDAVAAMEAAGLSFEQANHVAGSLTRAIVTLGGSSQDAGSALEDLAELSREGVVTMGDLREVVSFTNDPVRTLADAFSMSEDRIRAFIEAEQQLSLDRVTQVASVLREMSGDVNTLTGVFNRALDAAIDLFETFNQAGGVVDTLKGQLRDMAVFLRSDAATEGMLRLADVANRLISETLPNLARSTVQHWDTIVTAIKSAAGFLVGAAVGGLPGGVIGAIIAGTDNTRDVMQTLERIISGLTPVWRGLGAAIQFTVGIVETAVSELTRLGNALGFVLAKAESRGGITLESKLRSAKGELESLRKSRDRLEAELSEGDLPESFVEERRKELQALEDQVESAEERVRSLRIAMGQKLTGTDVNDFFNDRMARDLQRRIEAVRVGGASPASGGGGGGPGRPAGGSLRQPATLSGLQELFGATGGGGPNLVQTGRTFKRPGAREGMMETPGDIVPERLRDLVHLYDMSIDLADRLETAAQNVGDAFADSFTRAVIEGEKLSDVLESLGKDIARIVLRQGVSKPLGNMATDFARDLFTAGATGSGGGATAMGPRNPAMGPQMASGGITRGPSIAGEAGPEAVVPLPDGRSIPVEGGGTQVIINDLRGADAPDVEQRETRGADGQRAIELTIRDTVAGQMQRGELDGPMRKRFGVGPTSRGR